MRTLIALVSAALLAVPVIAQQPDVPPRFDILHSAELYKQGTPQETLTSVIGAASRDRYDYVAAHLLDPAFIDARLAATKTYFERVAAEQLAGTAAGQLLSGADLQRRVQETAMRLNVKQLADAMRRKMNEEPDTIRELKRFAREGQFMEAGDTAIATIKDTKDRALYFKKVGGRWFLDNRKDDRPAAKE